MQKIGNHTAQVLKHKETGERFVRIDGREIIPLGIAAMGAGKDAWLRKITCKCPDCGERYPINDLTDSGYCWNCVDAEIESKNA